MLYTIIYNTTPRLWVDLLPFTLPQRRSRSFAMRTRMHSARVSSWQAGTRELVRVCITSRLVVGCSNNHGQSGVRFFTLRNADQMSDPCLHSDVQDLALHTFMATVTRHTRKDGERRRRSSSYATVSSLLVIMVPCDCVLTFTSTRTGYVAGRLFRRHYPNVCDHRRRSRAYFHPWR